MAIDCIDKISAIRIKLPTAEDLKSGRQRDTVGKIILRTLDQFNNNPTLLEPVDDMRIPDQELHHAVNKRNELHKRNAEHPLKKLQNFASLKAKFDIKVWILILKIFVYSARNESRINGYSQGNKRYPSYCQARGVEQPNACS